MMLHQKKCRNCDGENDYFDPNLIANQKALEATLKALDTDIYQAFLKDPKAKGEF